MKSKQQVVSENFEAFEKQLPQLLQTHAGKYALLRDKKVVEFFDSVDAAKNAGYRPCKRCVPGEQSVQSRKIQEACRYIDKNFDVPLSLKQIADHVAINERRER